MFNIAEARKYDKNANNDLYWLFGEFLRVLILQDRFSRPYLICVFIFRQFGRCDQSWLKFRLCGPTKKAKIEINSGMIFWHLSMMKIAKLELSLHNEVFVIRRSGLYLPAWSSCSAVHVQCISPCFLAALYYVKGGSTFRNVCLSVCLSVLRPLFKLG